MYNFEEIKEILIPYAHPDFGGVWFSRSTNETDSFEVIYDKDGVTIYYSTNASYIDCIGLSEEHINEMCGIINRVYQKHVEEYEKEMERLRAEEEYYYEDQSNYDEYYDEIGYDPEASYDCLRSSLIRHTEELLTLLGHTADTLACELQVSVQDVERIMSRLKDKIKETTNL
jgi:hypothetical protein